MLLNTIKLDLSNIDIENIKKKYFVKSFVDKLNSTKYFVDKTFIEKTDKGINNNSLIKFFNKQINIIINGYYTDDIFTHANTEIEYYDMGWYDDEEMRISYQTPAFVYCLAKQLDLLK